MTLFHVVKHFLQKKLLNSERFAKVLKFERFFCAPLADDVPQMGARKCLIYKTTLKIAKFQSEVPVLSNEKFALRISGLGREVKTKLMKK